MCRAGGSFAVMESCRSPLNVERRKISIFFVPLAGAESDSCGRNGRSKGSFGATQRGALFDEQGTILETSPHRGHYAALVPGPQGGNERRPTNLAHFTLENMFILTCPGITRAHLLQPSVFFVSFLHLSSAVPALTFI